MATEINKETLYDGNPKITGASVLSGVFLVIGTVVGGGIFSLPIALSGSWFSIGTIIVILLCIMMTLTALMLVEVNLHFKVGSSFGTFTRELMGKTWGIIVGVALVFVLYILTYAYISGAASAINGTFWNYGSFEVNKQVSVLFVTLIVSLIVWLCSSTGISRIITILIVGKFTAFFVTFSGLLFSVNNDYLLDVGGAPVSEYLPYILMTLPFVILSFGFHGNVPTMVKHYGRDAKKIVRAIVYGMLFVLALYIFWLVVSMGNIARNEYGDIIQKGGNIDVFVNAFMGEASPTMKLILTFFSNFAISASLLTATLGLFDYLSDQLKLDNSTIGRFKAAALTYVPPGLLCAIYPDGFLIAIGYAGVAFTLWGVVLPPLLVIKSRQIFAKEKTLYRVPVNNFGLIFTLIIGFIVYLTVFLDVFGYLPVFKG